MYGISKEDYITKIQSRKLLKVLISKLGKTHYFKKICKKENHIIISFVTV